MIKKKTKQVMKEETVITEVICDICGEKFTAGKIDPDNALFGNPITTITITGVYGSNYDGERIGLHICDKCMNKFLNGEPIKLKNPQNIIREDIFG